MGKITVSQLEKMAQSQGVSVDVMAQVAKAQGYTIETPQPVINVADLLATVEGNDEEIIVEGSMDDFLTEDMTNQEIYDLLIAQTNATLYEVARATIRNEEPFVPTAFYEKNQYNRQAENTESRWYLVMQEANSLNVEAGDTNKDRLVLGMIAWYRSLATLQEVEIPANKRKASTKKATKSSKQNTVKVNEKTGKTYVEAPSQAKAHAKANASKNDSQAMHAERHAQVEAFMAQSDFEGFPYVESYLRGSLNYNATKAGIATNLDEVTWQEAVNAKAYRKAAKKAAKANDVLTMAQLIVENKSTFKSLAFVNSGGFKVARKYREFGDTNPLYAGLEKYIEFFQQASKVANELIKAR